MKLPPWERPAMMSPHSAQASGFLPARLAPMDLCAGTRQSTNFGRLMERLMPRPHAIPIGAIWRQTNGTAGTGNAPEDLFRMGLAGSATPWQRPMAFEDKLFVLLSSGILHCFCTSACFRQQKMLRSMRQALAKACLANAFQNGPVW